MKKLFLTAIQFPEITLPTSAAAKLRGFFGNIFKEKSPLLHNHFETGESIYRYPLVQYKVIRGIPTLVGIEEGGRLLQELFLQIQTLHIGKETYQINHKKIHASHQWIGASEDELYEYHFRTFWIALNQKNYEIYKTLQGRKGNEFLNKQLTNHLISLCKGVDYWEEKRIVAKGDFHKNTTHFKENLVLGFSGKFITNLQIPQWIGIGKWVSRGFGALERV